MHVNGRGVVKNSATTLATMVGTMFVALASKALMSRMIGPEGMGVYSLVILVPSLAFVFGNLGINTSNIYFVGNRKFDIDRISGTVLISAFTLGAVTAVIVSTLAWLSYHTIFRDASHAYAVMAIVSIPCIYLMNNFMSVIQGRNLITHYNLINFVSVALSFVLLAVFLLAFRLGVTGAVLAWFISMVFNAGFAAYKVSGFTRIPLKFDRDIFRAQISYGSKAYVANLAGFLVRRVDVLLVANIVGTTQLGYYSIAYTIAEMMWYIASSASIALIPFVAGSDEKDSKAVTAAVVRCTLWATGLLCLLVPRVDRYAIRVVFSAAFLPSVAPLRWLLPGILLGAIEKTLAADLIGRGKPIVTMVSACVAFVVNLIVNIVLIPRLGISGAAIASSVAYVLAALMTMTWFIRIAKCRLSEVLIIKRSDIYYFVETLSSVTHQLVSKKHDGNR